MFLKNKIIFLDIFNINMYAYFLCHVNTQSESWNHLQNSFQWSHLALCINLTKLCNDIHTNVYSLLASTIIAPAWDITIKYTWICDVDESVDFCQSPLQSCGLNLPICNRSAFWKIAYKKHHHLLPSLLTETKYCY